MLEHQRHVGSQKDVSEVESFGRVLGQLSP